jgi:hypothetical protein
MKRDLPRAAASILLAIQLLRGECVAVAQKPKFGALEVLAFDELGGAMPAAVTVFTEGNQRVTTPLSRLAYGTYKIRVESAGFYTVTREVMVHRPQTAIRVVLGVAMECGTPRDGRLAGKLKGFVPTDTWVKAVPLRGVGPTSETRAESNGDFAMSGLGVGEHVLLVTSGSRVLHQGVYSARYAPDAIVEIVLAK